MKVHPKTRSIALAVALLGAPFASLVPQVVHAQAKPALPPDDPAAKQRLQELGNKYKTGWELYQALQQQMPKTAMKMPDWSGVWTRGKGGLSFDPDIPATAPPTTVKLTAQGQQRLDAKVKQLKETGGEYDPLSDCRPPSTPRWFTEPFLREMVVTKDQTWLMEEQLNDVRRVYTDGRPHTPTADAVPSANGDTIGFWSGETLVAHTSQLIKGQYQRGMQPDYSEQVEVVERWRKVDDRNILVDLWVYDPPNLVQPWYTRQVYTRLSDPDKSLRLRYWDCHENNNNDVMAKDDGTSQFKGFGFVPDNAKASSDPAVKAAAQPKK